jgi:two-component system OmpR family response regulator
MLTAKTEKEDIIKRLDLGADDYLIQPFDTGKLLTRVRAASRCAKAGYVYTYIGPCAASSNLTPGNHAIF